MDYIFETARLGIRKFTLADAEALLKNHAEEDVRKWIPNESYADLEEARSAINFYMDRVNARTLPYVLAVELKETGELIGDTGVNIIEGSESDAEIGYVICRKHHNKGYATELVRAMSAFVFSTFHIGVLFGRVMQGNNASVKVLEKNGYFFVGEEFGAADDPYGKGMLLYKLAANSITK